MRGGSLNFSKENGVQKIDKIFHHLSGTEAIVEFIPSNYEMNNPDAYLTTRKITKNLTVTLTPPSDQSSNLVYPSKKNKHDTPSGADIKGKKHITQDDNSVNHSAVRASDPLFPGKTLRRGIVIKDVDTDQLTAASTGIKIREKKQKN